MGIPDRLGGGGCQTVSNDVVATHKSTTNVVNVAATKQVTKLFEGSVQIPDTVTKQVIMLEKVGILKNVSMTRSMPPQIRATDPANVLECISKEGSVWLPEQQECEYMDANTCTTLLGSNFDSCASACRNVPDSVACDLKCVPVCEF